MMGRRTVIVGLGLVVGAAACAHHRPARPAPATRPAATRPAAAAAATTTAAVARGGVYEGEGVRVAWPAGWERAASKDYVLLLTGDGGAGISLDVPSLPAHVPGWIPLGMVVDGYLDDLRKQEGKLEVREETPPAGALGGKVRMVRSEWGQSGGQQETAVLVVHGDHVYILRGRSDAGHERETRDAMEEIVGSWRWVAGK